jgi:excisionase family DNA binding protein
MAVTTNVNATSKPILSRLELMAYLRISKNSFWRLQRSPDAIPGYRVGGLLRFRRADVDEWLSKHPVEPSEAA